MPSGNGRSLLAKIITGQDLSALIGRTTRQIRNLTKNGMIELATDKTGRVLAGRYVLGPTILKLFERERELHADDPDEKRYRAARATKEETNAKLAQFELEVKRGKYHPAEIVEFYITTMITACRSRLLAIPSRSARLLVGQTDFRTIYDLIYKEIELALQELSEYDRDKFAEQALDFIESLPDSGDQ